MKKTLLKISMLIAALIFVTSASWADSGKRSHRKYVPEKRIQAKHHGGSAYRRQIGRAHV